MQEERIPQRPRNARPHERRTKRSHARRLRPLPRRHAGEPGRPWLDYLEERAYSERTLANRWCLRDFLRWCQERDLIDPATITKPILESYQRYLFRYRQKNGKPLGVTTQRDRLGALQRFFRGCAARTSSRQSRRRPRTPAQTGQDLAQSAERGRTRRALRAGGHERCSRAAGPLHAGAALLLRHPPQRVDQARHRGRRSRARTRQRAQRQGRQEPRRAPGRPGKDWFERYRDEARPRLELDTSERALFLSGYGTRLNPNYVGNWVKRTMKAVGIEKQGSCHLLRHTCATHMHDNGADIRFIQILLGHASLETTQIYTEVSIGSCAKSTRGRIRTGRTGKQINRKRRAEIRPG